MNAKKPTALETEVKRRIKAMEDRRKYGIANKTPTKAELLEVLVRIERLMENAK